MERIDFGAFSWKFWQELHQFLVVVERAGVDVRFIRQVVETHKSTVRANVRRNKRKPKPTGQKHVPEKPATVKQSNIVCPDCQKGYLQVKRVDDVTYTACPQCRKSVEFK